MTYFRTLIGSNFSRNKSRLPERERWRSRLCALCNLRAPTRRFATNRWFIVSWCIHNKGFGNNVFAMEIARPSFAARVAQQSCCYFINADAILPYPTHMWLYFSHCWRNNASITVSGCNYREHTRVEWVRIVEHILVLLLQHVRNVTN